MTLSLPEIYNTHLWIRPITLAYVPSADTPALDLTARALLDWFRTNGCTVQDTPTNDTELVITTAQFGHNVTRDESLMFHAKRKYRLSHRPPLLTLVDIPEVDYQHWLTHFAELAQRPPETVDDVQYPGLGPQAVEVIAMQARRGGPEVAMGRFLQSQFLSLRLLAVRTVNDRPEKVVSYDLAGAHPTLDARDLEVFGEDLGLRLLAATCARDADNHIFLPDLLPRQEWELLTSPDAMMRAGTTFTSYGFFTDPIRIEKLLGYRGLSDAISAQYSEGCYAVFEPDIPGLITTATGSSKLVDKRAISRDDQAIVVDVKPERDGAVVKPVEGNEGVRPSVEAMEMMSICKAVGTQIRTNAKGEEVVVPNVRAMLHGHLGIASYDPAYVESVTLDAPFYRQLVSCGTGALANGTSIAFARSESLQDPLDPRLVVFLEQPGHGIMVIEKWDPQNPNKEPFATLQEYMEAGYFKVMLNVPQGAINWAETHHHGQRLFQKAE